MGTQVIPQVAFNRGLISRLGLARIDTKRYAFSAEFQTNWMPRVLGSMMLRPGLSYLSPGYQSKKAFHVPFTYALSDQAMLELTDKNLRVRINDVVVQRVAVSTAITNGDFSVTNTGWSDDDEVGGVSTVTGGFMTLLGDGTHYAIRTQSMTVAGGDLNKRHALHVVVTNGPVIIRVGSTAGASDYFSASLATGTHSLDFVPTSSPVFVRFMSRASVNRIVDSCQIEAAGDMLVATPWLEADLKYIRYEQSADVVWVTCRGYQQYKIQRTLGNMHPTAWSVVVYQPDDGPFMVENVSTTTLAPAALHGNTTMQASADSFTAGNVGSIFRISSIGQLAQDSFNGAGQFGGEVRVTGVGTSRSVGYSISGTFSQVIAMQQSIGNNTSYTDYGGFDNFTSAVSSSFNDGLDNQIVYYRWRVKTYTSGTANVTLTNAGGSITGIARITGYVDAKNVNIEVLKPFGGTAPSAVWSEGLWSPRRGYPSAVCLHEGRLWFAGADHVDGSVSEAYESFDDTIEGDSAPIDRTIGSGPIANIQWLLPLQRLVIGAELAEWTARSSSFDEPLTATAFTLRAPSTQGSSTVAGVKIDQGGLFVNRSGERVYQLTFDSTQMYDYSSGNRCEYVPEIGKNKFLRLAVQRNPDTRIHALRGDGTVAVLVSEPLEDVSGWVEMKTPGASGFVEDIVVMPDPDSSEDAVYYYVRRTVNGNTVRYLERWAKESECIGSNLNKQADSFIIYSGVATTTIGGLSHLTGQEVIVWGDGIDYSPLADEADIATQKTYTVSNTGTITLDTAVSNAVVGLPYQAFFKTTKLAYAANGGTALGRVKTINELGLILADTHNRGLKYGRSDEKLMDLSRHYRGKPVGPNDVFGNYDDKPIPFPGDWSTDERLCLFAMAPRPCTVLAATMRVSTDG